MARVTIESAAAPAAQGPLETQLQQGAAALMVAGACIAAVFPGVLLGAAAMAVWKWAQQPKMWVRLVCAVVLLAPLIALHASLAPAWLWRDMLAQAFPPGTVAGVDAATTLRSIATEALGGPLWFEAMLLATVLARRRVTAQVRHDHRLDKQRWRAISGNRQRRLPMVPGPHISRADATPDHPDGSIRLGLDGETSRPFDLELPSELATHVFLPGASGSGKTTTLTRLADGALANWFGAIFVDCKAGDLGETARMLAQRYGLPFYLVDPDAEETLGYNPCSGDAASVANKLVGAFTYGPAAEIYKNIAMEAIPVVVRGLEAAGEDVTLDALYDAFGPRGMAKIAQKIPPGGDDERVRQRLLGLASNAEHDRVGKGGYAGLQRRLGALLEGKFGDLFRAEEMLDWENALAEPSVVYIALSTLASSEDVDLMGRVIAQDLKQVCDRRIKARARGEDPVPVLAIFDEFAALHEADQLVDLLLQARQALMPTVISTQYLPESTPLRKACLGAGLLVVHRVEAEDAEAIAAQFGTRRATEVTSQVDYETGFSEKGSIRRVDKYNVHPNEIRNFKVGQVAVRSVPTERYTIVRVFPDPDSA
jgi:hypothetical protein